MTKESYIVYSNVTMEPDVTIGEFSVIGKPTRPQAGRPRAKPQLLPTFVGQGSIIGSHVLVEAGAHVGRNCIVESGAVIESGVTIGDRTFVVHGGRICGRAAVGQDCVIGGFVAERCRIGDRSRVLGSLVHRHQNPTLPWDEIVEPGPTLENCVFVAMHSIVIGEVTLSSHVYVAVGAIVTRDVPSFHVACGVNRLIPAHEWRGSLSDSSLWS